VTPLAAFSRDGWRGRWPGGGLLGDDLGAEVDALVADRNVGGLTADDRGDLVAAFAAERTSHSMEHRRSGRTVGGVHAGNASAGTVWA